MGSKAELAMVMSILASHPGANLVCNGIKDAEYMELVGRLLLCCVCVCVRERERERQRPGVLA